MSKKICMNCKKPIKDSQLVIYDLGEWYDGDWHRGCLPYFLAFEELNQALRKLGRVLLERLTELWQQRAWRVFMYVGVVLWVLMIWEKVKS